MVDYYVIYYDSDGNFTGYDSLSAWAPSMDGKSATQGIATLGGGNITLDISGDFLGQAGTFNAGNLTLSAGGDINGRFLNNDGTLTLSSFSSIGGFRTENLSGTVQISDDQVIELFDSSASLSAQGKHYTGNGFSNPSNCKIRTDQ